MLKAQHPGFELYNQEIHARFGVACADCHMPYQRVGATKISHHPVRSPLLNINRACQTAGRFRCATSPWTRCWTRRGTSPRRSVPASQGSPLDSARQSQRRAQFLLDFIEAENSMGFHADQEATRVLMLSLNHVRLGEAALRGVRATVTRRPAMPAQLVTPSGAH